MTRRIRTQHLNDPVREHMHGELIALPQDQTAAESLKGLRERELSDRIIYLYVVDEQQRLVGALPVRRLLTAPPEAMIRSIMITPAISVSVSATIMEACELFWEYRYLALPVVDEEERLCGVVDLSFFTDEVAGNLVRQSSNAFQLIGIHVNLGRRASLWTSFKDRFPWLMCNILSGIACAIIASRHELLIQEITILALFLTVVLALGESVSVQSMSITLQGLKVGRLGWRQIAFSLRREFFSAATLGFSCGGIVAIIIGLWRHQLDSALVVGACIVLSMITACLLGVIVPTAIHLLRINPKVAGGPIVLAISDITTLLFYFNLSNHLLRG